MQKVQMMVHGKAALVDADMAKKIIEKGQLVQRGLHNQKMIEEETNLGAKRLLIEDAKQNASKIIGLNRRIRKGCVQFI